MLSNEMGKGYPSADALVEARAASRVNAKDASLYDFSPAAQACSESFMGWADLASNPPYPVQDIQDFADAAIERGLTDVILIGQGGSTQAPMTVSKFNKANHSQVAFQTIDSDSPVRIRGVLSKVKPESTIIILASKSGGTIEPRLALRAVRSLLASDYGMSEEEIPHHLVAITDPGSKVEQQAHDEGWAAVFSGEPTVGGRFSALSVFGLLPAALVGIRLDELMQHALEAERQCSQDSYENPAICLASFLYDNYVQGRDKFAFVSPKRGRVLGLWVEQLVAESLGKEGKGILPGIEVDTLLLAKDPGDRTAIVYRVANDSADERRNFEASLSCIDAGIPRMEYEIGSVGELVEHFVLWEYAIAFCGYLMEVCPFDQPDVAVAKAKVLDILGKGEPEPDFVDELADGGVDRGQVEVRLAPSLKNCSDLRGALKALFASVQPGDYVSINAFMPFAGEGRRESLEAIRHSIAASCGVAASLEIGPRYLHSIGQLHKGGPNKGVFLVLSADEPADIPLEQEAASMGSLAKAQAEGELVTLSERGRRCVHLHLPDNSGVTLRLLANIVAEALEDVEADLA